MKSLWKVVSLLVVLAALAGGGYLVKQNQETRRGAAQADTSVSLLSGTTTASLGDQVDVKLWLNSGSTSDKISGGEISISYDRSKLKLLSGGIQTLNGFELLNNGEGEVPWVDSGSGPIILKLIVPASGAEKSGAVNVANLKFETIASGQVSLNPSGSILLYSGSLWTIAKKEAMSITIGGGTVTSTIKPTNPVATATGTSKPKVTLNISASPRDIDVGEESVVEVRVATGTNKLSSVQIKINYDEAVEVKAGSGTIDTYFENTRDLVVDSIRKTVTIHATTAKTATQLKAGDIGIAKIVFVGKKTGSVTIDMNSGNSGGPGSDVGYQVVAGSVGRINVQAVVSPTATVKPCPTLGSAPNTACYKSAVNSLGCNYWAKKEDGVSCGDGKECEDGQCVTLSSFVNCSNAVSISHGRGNANCDATIDTADYEIWRHEAIDLGGMTTSKTGWKADFDQNRKVDMADYSIYYNSSR